MATRSLRRTLLALSACLLLALAFAWAFGRRPRPDSPPTPPEAARDVADVAVSSPEAAPPAPRPAERDPSGIPHTQLPLRLLATVVNENPALSLASVDDVERNASDVMKEGQRFHGRPKVQIARIERARILIDNDGAREQLVIVRRAADVAPVSPEEREHRRELARRLRELTDAGTNNRGLLGEEKREGLLAEGDVSAVYEDGKIVGVQVEDIREGGFYDQIGLQNGDVVTEINGVSISDPDAMVKVIGEFVSADELSIALGRGANGAPQTIVVPTPPLREAAWKLGPAPAPE